MRESALMSQSAVEATPQAPRRAPRTPTQALLAGFEWPSVAAPAVSAASPTAAVTADTRQTALQGPQFRQGFRIGPLNLMLRFQDGSELTEMPAIRLLPNAPRWMCGMANLHGMLIPVFDLASYLQVARDAQHRPMLLVLGHGADAAGVIIDGMPQRLRWQAAQEIAADLAPPRLSPHVRASCLIGEQVHFDLDVRTLLDAFERALQSTH